MRAICCFKNWSKSLRYSKPLNIRGKGMDRVYFSLWLKTPKSKRKTDWSQWLELKRNPSWVIQNSYFLKKLKNSPMAFHCWQCAFVTIALSPFSMIALNPEDARIKRGWSLIIQIVALIRIITSMVCCVFWQKRKISLWKSLNWKLENKRKSRPLQRRFFLFTSIGNLWQRI